MNDVLMRAFHSFWQSFVVVFFGGLWNVLSAFQGGGLSGGKAAVVALVLAAVAAGLSALKTMFVATK